MNNGDVCDLLAYTIAFPLAYTIVFPLAYTIALPLPHCSHEPIIVFVIQHHNEPWALTLQQTRLRNL